MHPTNMIPISRVFSSDYVLCREVVDRYKERGLPAPMLSSQQYPFEADYVDYNGKGHVELLHHSHKARAMLELGAGLIPVDYSGGEDEDDRTWTLVRPINLADVQTFSRNVCDSIYLRLIGKPARPRGDDSRRRLLLPLWRHDCLNKNKYNRETKNIAGHPHGTAPARIG